jgi:hypothetical protein
MLRDSETDLSAKKNNMTRLRHGFTKAESADDESGGFGCSCVTCEGIGRADVACEAPDVAFEGTSTRFVEDLEAGGCVEHREFA